MHHLVTRQHTEKKRSTFVFLQYVAVLQLYRQYGVTVYAVRMYNRTVLRWLYLTQRIIDLQRQLEMLLVTEHYLEGISGSYLEEVASYQLPPSQPFEAKDQMNGTISFPAFSPERLKPFFMDSTCRNKDAGQSVGEGSLYNGNLREKIEWISFFNGNYKTNSVTWIQVCVLNKDYYLVSHTIVSAESHGAKETLTLIYYFEHYRMMLI
ncbi:hypothetical protein BDA99DRAFT_534757 [Phascolomyces articulosus]|uniref:Uncharacterized protein n=1 Tax=Phascolomyces articulosus TaxID=60185 RepID=A0AAD5KLR4_9FUNG|nr:hypothetical protein BDA99DRAFT_534757 [Phascolomyces articulosus]